MSGSSHSHKTAAMLGVGHGATGILPMTLPPRSHPPWAEIFGNARIRLYGDLAMLQRGVAQHWVAARAQAPGCVRCEEGAGDGIRRQPAPSAGQGCAAITYMDTPLECWVSGSYGKLLKVVQVARQVATGPWTLNDVPGHLSAAQAPKVRCAAAPHRHATCNASTQAEL